MYHIFPLLLVYLVVTVEHTIGFGINFCVSNATNLHWSPDKTEEFMEPFPSGC